MNKNSEISDQIHEIASKTKAIADLMWAGAKGIETAEKTLSDLGWYFYDSMSQIEELANRIE